MVGLGRRGRCILDKGPLIVFLPGFQKGRDIKLAKKGQFPSYKEKLEKRTEFHSF
jgi:hypothetical protein